MDTEYIWDKCRDKIYYDATTADTTADNMNDNDNGNSNIVSKCERCRSEACRLAKCRCDLNVCDNCRNIYCGTCKTMWCKGCTTLCTQCSKRICMECTIIYDTVIMCTRCYVAFGFAAQ